MAARTGYLRFPTINADTVVFVCEDDLWTVPSTGGPARRLTANLAEVSRPRLSPDGELVAFTSREEEHPEVWVMDAGGGPARRLTYLGALTTTVVGWSPDRRVVAVSAAGQPFRRWTMPLLVDPESGATEQLRIGPCREVSWAPDGAAMAIGRYAVDPARWKRYRGGTAGQLWVDRASAKPAEPRRFRRILADIDHDLASPMWVGGRIYFLSDHEGIGNIYSVRPNGSDLRRHTDHDEFYARFPSSDGTRIVYQHAGELWLFDPALGEPARVDVEVSSPQVQRNRRFVPPEDFLTGYAPHPDGRSVVVETRGQLFDLPLWEDAARPLRPAGIGTSAVRQRLATWLADGESVVAVSDEGGDEALVVHTADGVRRLDGAGPDSGGDIGDVHELVAAPAGDPRVAVVNQRHELWVVDVGTGRARMLDASNAGGLSDAAWSPDGAWIAYSRAESQSARTIRVASAAGGTVLQVTRPEFRDFAPAWDPSGRYLYFLSARVFDPVPDEHFLDLNFPQTVKPFVVALRAADRSPFQPQPRPMKAAEQPAGPAEPPQVEIDVDGLDRRAVALPVDVGRYSRLTALSDAVLVLSEPILGTLGSDFLAEPPPRSSIERFEIPTGKKSTLVSGVNGYAVSADRSTLVYRAGKKLRAIAAGAKPPEGDDDKPGRASGWLDLGRIRVNVEPGAEWRQMFREAWRLQRDYFWDADMSGVDWQRVHDRYLPLLDRIGARSELADVIWEMQGELGTSHAYEIGGEYRKAPAYPLGFLGADLTLDRSGRWKVEHIVRADHWDPAQGSPLEAPGAGVREGDTILAVNGRPVGRDRPPAAELVHQAGLDVELTVADGRGRRPRRVVVKTLAAEEPLRYREWVQDRRRYVHDATDGRVGYVHVPDMVANGFAEFHRSFLLEAEREALVVDVRDNGGGFVSQLLLEKLARRRLGWDVLRYGPPFPYPAGSPAGPMVCLTNQDAGSDGDIFSHCWKLLELGPLVGTRTWGGVVGIEIIRRLVDGGITTQPQASFWFGDVGFGVENYGTDPDVVVDKAPQDWAADADPQLDRAVALVLRALRAHRPLTPADTKRPRLPLPKGLPARG
jgi:tricorn protease